MGEAKRRWVGAGYRYASAWDAVGERKFTEKGLDMLMTALVERGVDDVPRAGLVRLNEDGMLAPMVVAQVRDCDMPGHGDMTGPEVFKAMLGCLVDQVVAQARRSAGAL
jgi:hypothetical protein